MTRTATVDLGEFEGSPVGSATIAIRNAGDGLSKAMEVEPAVLHQGDTVYVVLETEVAAVEFRPIDGSTEVTRKHILKAGNASFIDRQHVRAALDATADKIQAARDAETGAAALDVSGTDPLPTTPPAERATKTAKKATKKAAGRTAKRAGRGKARLSSVPPAE